MRCLILCFLACIGTAVEAQDAQTPPDGLLDAGHCVVSAAGDWFGVAGANPYTLELGYVSGEKSSSGGDPLYLIEFSTPTHTQGFAFALESHGKGSHRELTLEFRTRFQQADDGTQRVNLVNPPLGGVGTNDEVLAAIQQVGFHTWRVPVAELRDDTRSVSCRTAEALR